MCQIWVQVSRHWPTAASNTRAIPHGDHSNDGLERSYVPSPWQPKSGNLLGAPAHSASIIFIPAWFVGYHVPCSFYQDNFHQLAGHAAQLKYCVHMLILPVKWISAKKANCYGGLWGKISRFRCRQTVLAGSRCAAEHAAFPLLRPAHVKYPK